MDDELECNMSLSQAILMENLNITGNTASADTRAAAAFPASLKDVVDRGSYPPEVVFNVDETGLFWKRMPSRMFISREQKRAPFSFGWKSLLSAQGTGGESAAHHGQCTEPPNLTELPTCIPVEILFLPPNTMSLIQPMNQGMIATFKAYYLCHTFHQLIEHTDSEDKQSMLDFWKQYHIMKAVSNIDLSWKEVTQHCLKAVWKKICPELCEDVQLPESIIAEIIDLVTTAGLGDTDAQDIEQLVQASGESLNNEELEELAEQSTQKPQDTSDSDTEPPKELSSELLNRALHQVNDIMDELVANNPHATRSRNARRIVLGGCFATAICWIAARSIDK
ncbi:tigger transposable element-derived 1-like [Pelobates cultripes]|uniref:Tigger transposable element-derived 1-like n=1 Tax=Pelobates cultripes TaxID=61616 RepID=A0AAD1RR52_PELCU|nr:tigger transposable element-derived 1-like [Pelobates cultripes]